MSLPDFDVEHVTHCFASTTVLEDVSLRLTPGRICALVGANGSGKSTLLNICLGFLKPSSGSVKIGGFDVATNASAARTLTAYVPEVARLYGEFSAVENLQFFERLMDRRRSKDECVNILARLGLTAAAVFRPTARLSKGMRQKVSIALGLLKNAAVFLLDEPTSGLDPSTANDFSGILRGLAHEGRTVVFTTHDLPRAQSLADEVWVLESGKIQPYESRSLPVGSIS